MKRIIFILIMLVSTNLFSLEILRQKNEATCIAFPLIDSSTHTEFKSGASGLDSEIDAFADGSNPDGFVDCTNEALEVGATGIYYLSLTQAEMNADYIIIQIKGSDVDLQTLLIRTVSGDPLSLAETTVNLSTETESQIDAIADSTDGDKENDEYSKFEQFIRANN